MAARYEMGKVLGEAKKPSNQPAFEVRCAWNRDTRSVQTVSAPAERSVLGTGMERGPEPLVPAVPAVGLLLEGSAALCACLSGDGSSSIMGLHE